jgi:hypothetical protein
MRELALAVFGVSIILSCVNMILTLRMIGRINEKLPPDKQMMLPFVGLDGKSLRDMYAHMYPDGHLHLTICRLSRYVLIIGLTGLVLLLLSW